MDDPRTDVQLILNVRGGDLHALGVLFLRHHQQVHQWCYRMTGNTVVADDMVQDVFLRILRLRHNFAGTAKFTTWLYRVARNVCLDFLASTKRQEAARGRLARESALASSVADTGDRCLGLLEVALQRLPVEKREVLILSRYHDMRYEEIAEVCGCSVGAVKTRVHRALKQLRRLYHDLEQADYDVRPGSTTNRRRSHR